MPIGNRLTNPGRALTSEFFGGDSDTAREIPAEFRAACDLRIVEIPLPWDNALIPLSDGVLASKAEQKATSERIRRTTYKQIGPITLQEVYTSRDKQLGTRTRSMRFEGDTIASPGPYRTVDTKNLGNKHFIETVEDDGTLFSGATSTKEIADVLPEIFKANIPSYEFATTLTGIITVPQILGPGEFYRSETQTDVFNMRRSIKTRTPVGGLPITFQEYKLTPEQQVETIYNILDNGLQILTPTPTMVEGEVKNLGNGQSVARYGIVPVVFDHIRYEVTYPDLIPAEFRANMPTQRIDQTAAGSASLPVPVPGYQTLSLIDEQVTDLTHRWSVSARAAFTGAAAIVNQEVTSEFGGGILYGIRTLDVTGQIVDTGLFVVSSAVKDLGNGLCLKETRQLATTPWPTLTSLIWDDEMQSYRQEDEQVVAAGTAPTSGVNFNEAVKSIDKWRSKRIRTTRSPSALGPGSAIVTYKYAPFKFPGILYRVANGYYVRSASAQLCRHKVKTWWQVSVGEPSITVNEITMDNVIISSLNDVTQRTYSGEVVHDTLTTFGTFYYPATTPSYTEYALGTPTGTYTRQSLPSLYSLGAGGYLVGDVLSLGLGGGSMTVIVDLVDGSGNIGNYHTGTVTSQFPLGLNGPITAGGGTGTGAQFYVTGVQTPNYVPGSAWIGQEKVVAAAVSPTDVPNLWKVQTKSVVMR